MKRTFIAVGLLAIAILLASACEPPAANTTTNTNTGTAEKPEAAAITSDEVKSSLDALEKAVAGGDAEALGKIYADDYTIVNNTGIVETKAQRLESMKTGAVKYETVEFGEPNIRVYGSTAIAVLDVTGKGTANGEAVEINAVATIVFNKGEGGVQEVSAQLTDKPKN